MDATTIKIYQNTKSELDRLREYKNESYDEVIRKMVFILKTCRKEPTLSQQTIRDIDTARKRMAKGEYYTHEEVKKMLRL